MAVITRHYFLLKTITTTTTTTLHYVGTHYITTYWLEQKNKNSPDNTVHVARLLRINSNELPERLSSDSLCDWWKGLFAFSFSWKWTEQRTFLLIDQGFLSQLKISSNEFNALTFSRVKLFWEEIFLDFIFSSEKKSSLGKNSW